jgi:hypothetical protein
MPQDSAPGHVCSSRAECPCRLSPPFERERCAGQGAAGQPTGSGCCCLYVPHQPHPHTHKPCTKTVGWLSLLSGNSVPCKPRSARFRLQVTPSNHISPSGGHLAHQRVSHHPDPTNSLLLWPAGPHRGEGGLDVATVQRVHCLQHCCAGAAAVAARAHGHARHLLALDDLSRAQSAPRAARPPRR